MANNHHPHYPHHGGGRNDPYYPPGRAFVPGAILHPALSVGSTAINYDVKKDPHEAIPAQVYLDIGPQSMLPHSTNPPTDILMASKAFPWVSHSRGDFPLTCKEVWKTLHEHLQQPITKADWWHIARDVALTHSVLKAYEKRVQPQARSTSPMLRIDYLGENTLFIGLEKDDAYVQGLGLPGTGQEVWVAKFRATKQM